MEKAEIIGYVAMTLTMVSFLFQNMTWLRVTNLAACLAFVIYGILIDQIPVIATNVIIGLIQIYWLIKKSNQFQKKQEQKLS